MIKVGRTESAVWAWSLLLEENPDSYEYIKACVSAKGADYGTSFYRFRRRVSLTSIFHADSTTAEGKAAAVAVLDGLAESHPKSLAVRRLALEIVSGTPFCAKALSNVSDPCNKRCQQENNSNRKQQDTLPTRYRKESLPSLPI